MFATLTMYLEGNEINLPWFNLQNAATYSYQDRSQIEEGQATSFRCDVAFDIVPDLEEEDILSPLENMRAGISKLINIG